MTQPSATATKAAPASGSGNSKAPVVLKPFKIGVQDVDDEAYDLSVTLSAANQQNLTPQYEVPSTGFLNGVYVLVEAVAAGNSASVAFTANGPFAVLASLTFTDTNNSEILGPITGWDLYVINKWGGYTFSDDPKQSPIYNASTGTGATGGSFTFALRIPLELVPRDALGSMPNKSASTPYKVKTIVAAASDVYSTSPTTMPSVRIRMTPRSYWEPTGTDGSGNAVAPQPPGVNTTQYWNKTDYTVNAGSMSPQLTSSVGFPVRNLIFVLQDNAGSRSQGEADWPDPFKLQLQSNIIVDRIKKLWWHYLGENYGYTGGIETAGGKDNGLYVKEFNRDFQPKPGWENRRSYLRTTDGMRMKAIGNIGGAGTHKLSVYTNYVGVGAGTSLAQITT